MRARALAYPAAEPGDLGERPAPLGRRAADLLGQHGCADAAPAGGVQAVLHGHVVGDHHRLDCDALVAGQVGRHLEVHDVARVVLDDMQHPGAAVDGLRGRQHLVGRGRGEHRTGAGRVEHAPADEPAVQRLVTGPPARDDRHLAPDRGVGARDEVGIRVHLQPVAVGRGDTRKLVPDGVLWSVDELLHLVFPPALTRRTTRHPGVRVRDAPRGA